MLSKYEYYLNEAPLVYFKCLRKYEASLVDEDTELTMAPNSLMNVTSNTTVSSIMNLKNKRPRSAASSIKDKKIERGDKAFVFKTMLPEDFEPTPYTVICGRGRKCADAIGNRRLQVIAQMFIAKYSQARKKEEKTLIVTDILEIVRDAAPEARFAFVRECKENGRWYEVENIHAREKVGTVLRDCLHSKYRSSTKSKLARRKQRKAIQANQDFFARSPMASSFLQPYGTCVVPTVFSTDEESVLSGEELEMDSIFA